MQVMSEEEDLVVWPRCLEDRNIQLQLPVFKLYNLTFFLILLTDLNMEKCIYREQNV